MAELCRSTSSPCPVVAEHAPQTSRKSANLYHHRHLETQCVAPRSSPTTPSRALYPAEFSCSLPHPRTLGFPLSPTPPTLSRAIQLADSLAPLFPPLAVSVVRDDACLSSPRVGETPPMPHFTPSSRCFFLASAPVKNRQLVFSLVLMCRAVFF